MSTTLAQIDLPAVLSALAERRPVFHSEADLQQELAWQVRLAHPDVGVRLEVRVPEPSRPGRRERVDLLFRCGRGAVVVEVKYLTDALSGVHDGEEFELPRQGAQDVSAYDVVKDIFRVEHFVMTGLADAGAVLVVSNDPAYWVDPAHGRVTGAAAFRLYDGSSLTGERAWGERSGPGTRKGREDAIPLHGNHRLRWRDFSSLPGVGSGRFRFLLVDVAPPQ
ncbi:MAG: hypothetical protein WBG36_04525 [Ornithinimicrobium sp.]